jgi:hypothetical protein
MLTVPIWPIRGDHPLLPSSDGRPVTGLVANVDLLLPESKRPGTPWPFRIDTGAPCVGVSLVRAEKLGLLRYSDRTVELRVGSADIEVSPESVRIGRVAAKLPALREEPFDWPVIFYPKWSEKRLLLGLAGVVSDLSFHFDGTPNGMSEFGSVTITLRPLGPPPS